MKEAIARFDQTLAAAANSGVQELVDLAACITQIMQTSSQGATAAAKRYLGEQMSLGYHRQDSLAIQNHRHNVRGALLAQIVLRTGGAHNASKTNLLAMTPLALRNHVQGLFAHANKAHPVINHSGQCAANFALCGRGGLHHKLHYVSSSGHTAHLCFIPTREMVWLRSVRIGAVTHNNVAPYGDGANFNRVLFAPWYPTTISATDSPASPHANRSTLDLTIEDKHSHTCDKAIGPCYCQQNKVAPEPFVMLKAPLVDSELVQEQRYQYNDSGDVATWDRQNIADDANVDPHWTNIPGGHFILTRELFQQGNDWKLRFTKERGNDNTVIGSETVDVIAIP